MTGKQSEVLQSIVDDFNANNGKGITVTALSQGAIPDLNKKIIAASLYLQMKKTGGQHIHGT